MKKFFPRVVVLAAICLLVLALNFTVTAAPAAAANSGNCMGTGIDAGACNFTISQAFPSPAVCPPCSNGSGAADVPNPQPVVPVVPVQPPAPGSPSVADIPNPQPVFPFFPGYRPYFGYFGFAGFPGSQPVNPGQFPSSDDSDAQDDQNPQLVVPAAPGPFAFPGGFGPGPMAFRGGFGPGPMAFPGGFGPGPMAFPGGFGPGGFNAEGSFGQQPTAPVSPTPCPTACGTESQGS